MKFLGMRLCEHDSNISYFDGTDVHYFKSERFRAIKINDWMGKHHAYANFESWMKEIKEMWNLEPNDLDEIGIVFDPWHYRLNYEDDDFFPTKKFDYLPYNITRIDHHYAHALSSWPVTKTCRKHFVFDAYGDYDTSWSYIEDDKLVDVGNFKMNDSLGNLMNGASIEMEIVVKSRLDSSGKFMGLQAYGNIDEEFLNKLRVFDMTMMRAAFQFTLYEQHVGDPLLAKHKKLDWARTVHYWAGEALVNHFAKYVDKDDEISFSGGCAQNVVWNTFIKNKYKNLVVFPHCNDEGLSLGVLEFFRKKHNLSHYKTNNFPYWQIQR